MGIRRLLFEKTREDLERAIRKHGMMRNIMTIHVTEAEFARDLHAVLSPIRRSRQPVARIRLLCGVGDTALHVA